MLLLIPMLQHPTNDNNSHMQWENNTHTLSTIVVPRNLQSDHKQRRNMCSLIVGHESSSNETGPGEFARYERQHQEAWLLKSLE